MRYISAFLCTYMLLGCMGAPRVDPDKLANVTNRRSIILENPISWKIKARNVLDTDFEQGLLPGQYTADKEDEAGTFFKGPENALWERGGSGLIQLRPGGFWLPKGPNFKPRFYYYIQPPKQAISLETATALNSQNTGSGQNLRSSSVGPQVVGTALGMAIVNTMVDADRGKIILLPDLKDEQLILIIRNLVESKN